MTDQYKITIEDRNNYIYAAVEGAGHDVDLFVKLVLPAIELSLQSEHKKLLLVDGIEDDWPPMMMEKLVKKLFEAGFDKLTISVYVPVQERQFNTYFAGTVGRNMGMNVAVSIDMDTAVSRLSD